MRALYAVLLFLCLASQATVKLLDFPQEEPFLIEVWMQKKTQAPLLVFLHPASFKDSQVWDRYTDPWAKKGYSTAGISLPGYGQTSGKMDFCGPLTLKALHYAIDFLKEEMGVSALGIIGFGQGGVAGALIASERTDVKCVVCTNGLFNLFRHLQPPDLFRASLLSKNYDFDLTDLAAVKSRSLLYKTSTLNAPIFILHRENHPIITKEEVNEFSEAMHSAHKECRVIFKEKTNDEQTEIIPLQETFEETEKWIDLHMEHVSCDG